MLRNLPRYLTRVTGARWLFLFLVALGLLAQTSSSQEGRKLGTCGPPPRKNPQRQTSAESMPPLPLPATPLRRSEPKAEPAPPLMIAKLESNETSSHPSRDICGR